MVFAVFAVLYLKEPFHWKHLVSFALIQGAVNFDFKK
ncbi:DMT family protein [Ferruginibacter sp.]